MTLEDALAALKAAQQKIDSLEATQKKHLDEKNEAKVADLQKKIDAATAELDKAKADVKRLEEAKAKEPKVDELVMQKFAIVDGARALHAKPEDVDATKSNREIMIAAIVARDANFKADGKSDDYVRAYFDREVVDQKKADASTEDYAKKVGSDLNSPITAGRLDGSDIGQGIRRLDSEFKAHQAFMMERYRGEDAATKASAKTREMVMTGKQLDGHFVEPWFDARDMMERQIAALKQISPRGDLMRWALLNGVRKDADPATAFFLRQLLYVFTKPYEVLYPEAKYAEIFPVTYEVPTGARNWAAHRFDDLGSADIVDDYADDAPNVDIVGQEIIGRLFPVRDQFTFSLQDIRSAMLANMPLDALKAVRARRIIERKCDALAAIGDSKRSLTGAANDANAATATATTKAKGGTQWIISGALNATANEILNDVNVLYQTIFSNTDGIIEGDTLVIGKNAYAVLYTLRLDNFNMRTVADYLLNALPWLKRIIYWPRLNTAGGSSVERIMLTKVDPEFFRLVVAQEFEQLPPQAFNMAWKTPCHKRFGEPQMMHPKSFVYMDNTSS